MGYQLGIDLGTTYSAAAVCRAGDGRRVEPEVVTLGSRAATVPSVLYIGDDGSVLVGEAAERRAVSDPDRVVREFKRRIGDPTPVVVAGSPWAAEELAARLVRWIVDQVAAREGGPADRIAVTHPASWGAHKKELLTGALACHGLQVTFLAEPQAAALHYASAERVEPGSTIAVYDLGGGTFDAAVLRKGAAADEAGFGLLGRPEGIAQLGGIDFDQAVFDHVVAGTPGAFDDLDDTDPAVLGAVSRLRRECTEAKETLSSDTEASVPVLLPGTQGSVRLHRGEFEQMIRPHVEETVTALRRAVESAGLTPDQLSAVLLVGGSSRIPLVAQLVSEQVGRPVAVDTDPKNTIAKGAALAVSPQPAASWPAVTMRPVEATGPVAPAAGVALLAAPAAAAVWAPVPTANPLPPANPVPAPVPMPVPAAMHLPPPLPRRGPAGPPMPPPRPSISSDWEREPAAPQRKRGPVGLLVGVGGVLAVAAVVVAVLTWPTASPATAGSSLSGQSTAEAQAEPTGGPVSPVSNPVVNANAESNGGQAQQQQPAGNGSKPAANAPAPVVKPPAGPVVAPAGPTSPAPVVQPPVVPPVAPPAPPVNPPVDPGTPPGGGTTDPGTGTPGGGTTDPGTGTPGGGTTDPGTTGGIADGGATPPAGGSTGGSPSGGTTSAPPAP